ncbi:sensor histidine kinase [Salinispirillum marinum]|uniref:histidine kinase n=2 Tax=Saccharospirillaceae TaxID=255527 RepID=A0ABV8BJF9_9GAMM
MCHFDACANNFQEPIISIFRHRAFASPRLQTVLLFQVTLPVLVLLAALLAVGLQVIADISEQRLQRDLRQVARAIHLPVSEALAREDLDQVQASVASVFDINEVFGAYLFDRSGTRLVSFGAVNPTREQTTEALELTEQGEFAQYERIRGESVYSFFLPLFTATGQPNGFLQVTRLRSDIEQELRTLNWHAWLAYAVVSLLIVATVISTHQWRVGQPLNALIQSMRAVAQGDRQHRAEALGPREMCELSQTFNRTLDALAESEQQAEQQRKARSVMAERLRQHETLAALGQLSAGVAHELGAPLTVVDGRARRLLKRLPNPEDQQELTDIRQQVQRMTDIVRQLLSYGRSTGQAFKEIPVTDWVDQCLHQYAQPEPEVQVSGGPDVTVLGDTLGLGQALGNLIQNAQQAPNCTRVQIHWRVADNLLELSIDDDGDGIPSALTERIFDPFFTTKQPGQGTGLGLAIVTRVLREHQGSITVHTHELGGTQFRLRLPLSTTEGYHDLNQH